MLELFKTSETLGNAVNIFCIMGWTQTFRNQGENVIVKILNVSQRPCAEG